MNSKEKLQCGLLALFLAVPIAEYVFPSLNTKTRITRENRVVHITNRDGLESVSVVCLTYGIKNGYGLKTINIDEKTDIESFYIGYELTIPGPNYCRIAVLDDKGNLSEERIGCHLNLDGTVSKLGKQFKTEAESTLSQILD